MTLIDVFTNHLSSIINASNAPEILLPAIFIGMLAPVLLLLRTVI